MNFTKYEKQVIKNALGVYRCMKTCDNDQMELTDSVLTKLEDNQNDTP